MAHSQRPRHLSLSERLTKILSDYKALCEMDRKKFILKIPPEEMWRFFIDGRVQDEGGELLVYFQSLQSEPITSDLKVCDFLKRHPDQGEFLDHCYVRTGEKLTSTLTLKKLLMRDRGWLPFNQTEPGYLAALMNAFHTVLDLKQDCHLDCILALHKTATASVQNLNYQIAKSNTQPGELRRDDVSGFSLMQNATPAGLKELLMKMKLFNRNLEFYIYMSEKSCISRHNVDKFIRANQSIDKLANKLNGKGYIFNSVVTGTFASVEAVVRLEVGRVIKHYNEEMGLAKSSLEKIRQIVILIQSLEQIHPFVDGNTRTFSMLYLNGELMKHGFPPAILNDPNAFGGFSIDELVLSVVTGMERSLAVAQGKMDLFGITTVDVLRYATSTEAAAFDALVEQEKKRRAMSSLSATGEVAATAAASSSALVTWSVYHLFSGVDAKQYDQKDKPTNELSAKDSKSKKS